MAFISSYISTRLYDLMHYNKIQIIETNKGFMDFFLLKTMRERTQGTIMLSQAGFDMQTRV